MCELHVVVKKVDSVSPTLSSYAACNCPYTACVFSILYAVY